MKNLLIEFNDILEIKGDSMLAYIITAIITISTVIFLVYIVVSFILPTVPFYLFISIKIALVLSLFGYLAILIERHTH